MTLTLYVEVAGRIKVKEECAYEDKEKIAEKLKGLYPGKVVVIFYKLKSKINDLHHWQLRTDAITRLPDKEADAGTNR